MLATTTDAARTAIVSGMITAILHTTARMIRPRPEPCMGCLSNREIDELLGVDDVAVHPPVVPLRAA